MKQWDANRKKWDAGRQKNTGAKSKSGTSVFWRNGIQTLHRICILKCEMAIPSVVLTQPGQNDFGGKI